jgi:hypothetical protein
MSLLDNFSIGFWHPFGPHAGETAEEIIARKRDEIDANGWTFWSFQMRRTLSSWHNEIMLTKPQKVLVFCSEGKGASDPSGAVEYGSSYCMIDDDSWQAVPSAIKIPHPIGKKYEASAFVVADIVHPIKAIELFPAQWHTLNGGPWRDDIIPTRGEYLIRRGGSLNIRRYRAVLVLKAPYLAVVSTSLPNP